LGRVQRWAECNVGLVDSAGVGKHLKRSEKATCALARFQPEVEVTVPPGAWSLSSRVARVPPAS